MSDANDLVAALKAERDRAESAEAKLKSETERLGREVNLARYGQPDFAWSIHVQAMAELEAKLARALEALIWCSGSSDFNEGGIAEKGWRKICAPLIAELIGGEDDRQG